jgi:hypothetical protein
MNRRNFLRGAAALAATGAAAPPLNSISQQIPEPSPFQNPGFAPTPIYGGLSGRRRQARFFEDIHFNYIFSTLVGSAYYRGADIGKCLAMAEQIPDGDRPSAFRALAVASDQLTASAAEAESTGDQAGARESYMHAASYIFFATYFVDPTNSPEAFQIHWLRHQELWDKAAALLEPRVDFLPFPYEKTTLPGYLFKVDSSGKRRPLLILINRNDGGMPTAWTFGIASALERGYNVYTFYGPGQGTARLQQNLYARADWERVLSPLLDYLLIRRDVDSDRIALLGIGEGGYLAARAAAFEPRFGACVVDPGVFDLSAACMQLVPKNLLRLLDTGDQQKFDALLRVGLRYNPRAAAVFPLMMVPFGKTSPFEVFKALPDYRLNSVAAQIRCPTLITEADGEMLWTGQSKQLYDALRCSKTLIKFAASDGADLSCEPKAPGLRSQRIFGWLSRVFR